MRTSLQFCVALGMLAVGYGLGINGALAPQTTQAQDETASEETLDKVKVAAAAVGIAMRALREDDLYIPAIEGVNSFAVTSGGLNALEDLENSRGVDPETFAGLYAGLAVDDVADNLGKDDQGRLTYKGKVIRMYPISRLAKMFETRKQLSGEEDENQ